MNRVLAPDRLATLVGDFPRSPAYRGLRQALQELAAKAHAGDAFVRDVLAKPKLWIMGGEHELEQLAGDWAPARPAP